LSSEFASHLGEWAALGTALCWTVSALSFESASKRVGSLSINWIRLVFAFLFLCIYLGLVRGNMLPVDATKKQWIVLSLSGLVGFVLGDLCLFKAFVLIGSRISMLIMALAPSVAACLGYVFLNEKLGWLQMTSMGMILSGVAMAVLKKPKGERIGFSHPLLGVMLALGGAVGQGSALILSKIGMADYNAAAATQIRIMSGIGGFSLLIGFRKAWPGVGKSFKNGIAMRDAGIGAFFGPFIGVTLSLLAVQHTQTGVASAIMSIVPVLIIPPSVIFFKERVTIKEVFGSVLAVVGVVLFFGFP
jgi:drug/metabolite transporter (DMT)-like permease